MFANTTITNKDKGENRYHIPILTKSMELIEHIAKSDNGMTIQEMVKISNHSKTSVYRIVCSLEEMGYIIKSPITGSFILSHKLFELGLSALGDLSLTEHSYEPMRRLRDKVRETVILGTLMNARVVVVEQIVGSHQFSFILKPGSDIGLHASAPGKVFLAYMEPHEFGETLSQITLTKYNPRTITNIEDMEKEVAKVRETGFGYDMGEELLGVRCVAYPIFNHNSGVAAAVWISGPYERLSDSNLNKYAQHVKECAEEISFKLGYRKNK